MSLNKVYDKFRHCTVSCETAKKYGGGIAYDIGYCHEWEGLMMITRRQDSLADIEANKQGIAFANQSGSCHDLCKNKYELEYP